MIGLAEIIKDMYVNKMKFAIIKHLFSELIRHWFLDLHSQVKMRIIHNYYKQATYQQKNTLLSDQYRSIMHNMI